jgi:hypothetical protein
VTRSDAHDCPGGCGAQVPRRYYACGFCWARLPRPLRDGITGNVGRDLAAHGQAMGDARRWYQQNERKPR